MSSTGSIQAMYAMYVRKFISDTDLTLGEITRAVVVIMIRLSTGVYVVAMSEASRKCSGNRTFCMRSMHAKRVATATIDQKLQ